MTTKIASDEALLQLAHGIVEVFTDLDSYRKRNEEMMHKLINEVDRLRELAEQTAIRLRNLERRNQR